MNEVEVKIRALQPWFQQINLGEDVWTKKDQKCDVHYKAIMSYIHSDLSGKSAIDIGCNAGKYSFELERRGASVTGIDTNQGNDHLQQARFCADVLKSEVQFVETSVLNIPPEWIFDIALFLAVFYHVDDFCKALEKLSGCVKHGGLVIVESLVSERSQTFYGSKFPYRFFVPSVNVLRHLLTEHAIVPVEDFIIVKDCDGTGSNRHCFVCERA